MGSNKKPSTEFLGKKEPIGTVIALSDDSSKGRSAKRIFNQWLFEYFEQLSTQQTGWGISFIEWLKITKGWKLISHQTYERVRIYGD